MVGLLMCNLYFYPRSPCGERQAANGLAHAPPQISIHALLAESDYILVKTFSKIFKFLSTLSLRRATISGVRHKCAIFYFYPRSPCGERPRAANCQQRNHQISIHALLAESDAKLIVNINKIVNFYPRSPCGERPNQWMCHNTKFLFLSTLSLRRATLEIGENLMDRKHFYPRSPCGERLNQIPPRGFHYHFYPRSPCGERQTHQ